jgi:hypothetical protein
MTLSKIYDDIKNGVNPNNGSRKSLSLPIGTPVIALITLPTPKDWHTAHKL